MEQIKVETRGGNRVGAGRHCLPEEEKKHKVQVYVSHASFTMLHEIKIAEGLKTIGNAIDFVSEKYKEFYQTRL